MNAECPNAIEVNAHNFSAVVIEPGVTSVLYCRNCGEVRSLDPSSGESMEEKEAAAA